MFLTDGLVVVLLWMLSEWFAKYNHNLFAGIFLWLAIEAALFGLGYGICKIWPRFKVVCLTFILLSLALSVVPFLRFQYPQWQPPELPQRYQNIYLIFGGTSTEMTPQEIKTAHYMSMGGFEPIKWRIVDNRFYIDVDIPIASEVIKVRGGQFSAKLPPKWDMNFNSNAMEIVTENNNPIYQVYYRRPDQVVVNGIFARGNFLVAATTNGIEWWRGESNVAVILNDFYSGAKPTGLKPIFKYPAFQHFGEYAP